MTTNPAHSEPERCTKREIAEVMKQRRFWRKYAKAMGWTLAGWSYCNSAQFVRKNGSSVYIGGHGHISVDEMDKLLGWSA